MSLGARTVEVSRGRFVSPLAVARRRKRRFLSEEAASRLFAEADALRDRRSSFCNLRIDRSGRCERGRTVLLTYRPASWSGASGKSVTDLERAWAKARAELISEHRSEFGEAPTVAAVHSARRRFFWENRGIRDRRVSCVHAPLTKVPLFVEAIVPCRKCPACLRRRAQFWKARGMAEWRFCANIPGCRAWMGSFTFTPEQHQRSRDLARAELAKQGLDFDKLSPEDQLGVRMRVFYGPLWSKYLRRLRRGGVYGGTRYAPAAFRFLMVVEVHRSGEPHIHSVFFETSPGAVKWHHISDAWLSLGGGHMKSNVAHSSGAVSYILKYVLKHSLTRIRASENFGNGISKRAFQRALDRFQVAGTGSEQAEREPNAIARRPQDIAKRAPSTPPGGAPPRVEGVGGCDLSERSERELVQGAAPGGSELGGSQELSLSPFGATEAAAEGAIEPRLSRADGDVISGFSDQRFIGSMRQPRPSRLQWCEAPVRGDQSNSFGFSCDMCGTIERLREYLPEAYLCEDCLGELDENIRITNAVLMSSSGNRDPPG